MSVFSDLRLSLLIDFRARKEICRKWLYYQCWLSLPSVFPFCEYLPFFFFFFSYYQTSYNVLICTVIPIAEPDQSRRCDPCVVGHVGQFYQSSWVPRAEEQKYLSQTGQYTSVLWQCSPLLWEFSNCHMVLNSLTDVKLSALL